MVPVNIEELLSNLNCHSIISTISKQLLSISIITQETQVFEASKLNYISRNMSSPSNYWDWWGILSCCCEIIELIE